MPPRCMSRPKTRLLWPPPFQHARIISSRRMTARISWIRPKLRSAPVSQSSRPMSWCGRFKKTTAKITSDRCLIHPVFTHLFELVHGHFRVSIAHAGLLVSYHALVELCVTSDASKMGVWFSAAVVCQPQLATRDWGKETQ